MSRGERSLQLDQSPWHQISLDHLDEANGANIVGDLQNILLGEGRPVLPRCYFGETGVLPISRALFDGLGGNCDLFDRGRFDSG